MPLPLKTERLVIRSYREDDATPLHEVFGSPDVMKWTPSPPSKDVAETAQRLARTMAFTARQPPGMGLWALELKDTSEFLGQVGLFPVEGKGPEVE
ncbi:MAG TPA: GNAT family N-acetyltransferase, partial [Candidatus Limnocylindria bacterium]